MKKLIAILAMVALVGGVAFSLEFGGTVIGSVVPLSGQTGENYDDAGKKLDNDISGYGLINRFRLEGSGESEDGDFGVWMRLGSPWYNDDWEWEGRAWWKPIDQFRLSIGGNSDGMFGKEGYAGWMFHQIVADTSVVKGSQAWGCDYTLGLVFRDAFFGGFGGQGLILEIMPMEMLAVNLIVPFISETGKPWSAQKTEDIFKKTIAQIDLNLDFGNIAFTFVSGRNELEFDFDEDDPFKVDTSKIHLFFGLNSIENLDLGISIGFPLPVSKDKITYNSPLAVGLGAKYAVSETFFIKARVAASFMGSVDFDGEKADMPFELIFEVLPGFAINDKATFYADIGVNFKDETKSDGKKVADSVMGWHFNPYIGIGAEWGPTFFAGVNVFSTGAKDGKNNTYIQWEIPIAMVVSF